MRELRRIIIHCSATPEGRDVPIATIRRWHVEERGFREIGYHYVVELDGTIKEGRPEEEPGAHAQGHNHDSIGVCYIGGVDADMSPKDTRTPEQKDALRVLVEDLRERYGQGVTVHGHNEVSSKACPSFDVQAEFASVGRAAELAVANLPGPSVHRPERPPLPRDVAPASREGFRAHLRAQGVEDRILPDVEKAVERWLLGLRPRLPWYLALGARVLSWAAGIIGGTEEG